MKLQALLQRVRGRVGFRLGEREFGHGDVGVLRGAAGDFLRELRRLKRDLTTPELSFYAHDILGSFYQLDQLLTGPHRELFRLAGNQPIADIGAADGDMAFFLEALGRKVHIVDHGPSNWNGLRGARALAQALGSRVAIHDIDLDRRQGLPEQNYGLIFFLGILYHLKNPLGVLEDLAAAADHMLLSTRTFERSPGGVSMPDEPVAYLLGADELNADPTNFWIFSRAGLERALSRAGWEVLDWATFGAAADASPTGSDQRTFLLARSRRRHPVAEWPPRRT